MTPEEPIKIKIRHITETEEMSPEMKKIVGNMIKESIKGSFICRNVINILLIIFALILCQAALYVERNIISQSTWVLSFYNILLGCFMGARATDIWADEQWVKKQKKLCKELQGEREKE
jgi:hypothetical protein